MITTILALQPPKISDCTISSRRQWFRNIIATTTAVATTAAAVPAAIAAPPIAIIAEELGYFPVTNKGGNTVYVAKRIQRDSSDQAIELAKHLSNQGAVVYETYWCPHSSRQRELFGKQAWAILSRVECSSQGFQSQAQLCTEKERIDGYPTWKFKKSGGKMITVDGERDLSVLAEASGFKGKFDESLEKNVPPMLGSQTCKLNKPT